VYISEAVKPMIWGMGCSRPQLWH